jgi:hypothetical protein
VTIVFGSTQERDWVLNSGAEAGARYTYGRMDDLLERRKAA